MKSNIEKLMALIADNPAAAVLLRRILEHDVEVINCGIGEIYYFKPDNLKLHCRMDEIKEQLEKEFLS